MFTRIGMFAPTGAILAALWSFTSPHQEIAGLNILGTMLISAVPGAGLGLVIGMLWEAWRKVRQHP